MSDSPYFSVIIPTYNREGSIAEAIQSVLDQTFKKFEVIVVDDGSTDNTNKIVSEMVERDARIRYHYQINQERSAARNKGISLAKGTYICFLDSDDLYLPKHLSNFHEKIVAQKHPKAVFLANPVYPSASGSLIEVPPFITDTTDPMELVIKTSIPSQLTCIHTEILAKNKFDESIRIGEDQELWSRIVKQYPLVKSDQYSVIIRDLGDRTINNMSSKAYLENLNLKKTIFKNDTEGRIRPEWRKFALSSNYFLLARSFLREHRISKFYFYALWAIILSPAIYRKEKIKLILHPKI